MSYRWVLKFTQQTIQWISEALSPRGKIVWAQSWPFAASWYQYIYIYIFTQYNANMFLAKVEIAMPTEAQIPPSATLQP
jgi:hypothetical protein